MTSSSADYPPSWAMAEHVPAEVLHRRQGIRPIESVDELACPDLSESDDELDETLGELVEAHCSPARTGRSALCSTNWAGSSAGAGISEAAGVLISRRRTSTFYGWRRACCSSGDVAVVSARREKLFGRAAETCGMYRSFRGSHLPEGFQIWCLSCNDSKGTGKRCAPAHIDSKKRRYACNVSKLPAKEFDTNPTARDRACSCGKMHSAAARAMRRNAKCRRVT